MLGFARRPGEVDWVDVNQLLEETLVLMEKKMRQLRIRITRNRLTSRCRASEPAPISCVRFFST
jgi:hypothetical protein